MVTSLERLQCVNVCKYFSQLENVNQLQNRNATHVVAHTVKYTICLYD